MIPTDRPCEPLHAAHRGEGMTGSHPQPAPHRETGTEDANDHLATQAESRTINFDLPALNSMRPTAPPSRPYGRYAVGLRPSLDPPLAHTGDPALTIGCVKGGQAIT